LLARLSGGIDGLGVRLVFWRFRAVLVDVVLSGFGEGLLEVHGLYIELTGGLGSKGDV